MWEEVKAECEMRGEEEHGAGTGFEQVCTVGEGVPTLIHLLSPNHFLHCSVPLFLPEISAVDWLSRLPGKKNPSIEGRQKLVAMLS